MTYTIKPIRANSYGTAPANLPAHNRPAVIGGQIVDAGRGYFTAQVVAKQHGPAIIEALANGGEILLRDAAGDRYSGPRTISGFIDSITPIGGGIARIKICTRFGVKLVGSEDAK